jgi:hypothetical protein
MKQFFAFILLACCFACSSPNKIPDDIMDVNKMKPIVWDMMRATSLSQNMRKTDTNLVKKETLSNYERVFKVHHVTKEEFFKSYNYYLQHPDKNKILMDTLAAYANRQRTELYKLMR